jgi:hypothetical protein
MQLKFEAGDDTEIATATTQGPEEVAVRLFARSNQLSVRGDYFG